MVLITGVMVNLPVPALPGVPPLPVFSAQVFTGETNASRLVNRIVGL